MSIPVNLILPNQPLANSSANTKTLWQAAQQAQQAYNTAVVAYQNGVIADQVAAATTSTTA